MASLPLTSASSDMRLPAFIRKNMGRIIAEWETFAHTIIPNAGILELRDHAEEILDFIADDIETPQTRLESTEKSHGEAVQDNLPPNSAAEVHAQGRVVAGFDIVQMVSEYRALRASVVRLWTATLPQTTSADLRDLTRFHEAIDQALAESVASFTKKVDASRNLFLGILGHDIRNPLGAISMSAELIKLKPWPLEKQNMLATQIVDSSLRIGEIVDQLIDLARTKIGSGIAVNRAPMNMGELANSLVEETRARFPGRNLSLSLAGALEGDWDRARMGQVFTNLLGNAVQYSDTASRISVCVEGKPNEVRLTVHNVGTPIAADSILTIFDSLIRTRESEALDKQGSTNLGLGLFIAKEIAVSHGGTITVSSSDGEGTVFTVMLPRLAGVDAAGP